jgi:hypothetical protein
MQKAKNLLLCLFFLIALTSGEILVIAMRDSCRNKDNSSAAIDASQLESYTKDGFVVIHGLLDVDQVERLSEAGRAIASQTKNFPAYFTVVERGAIFSGGLSDVGDRDAGLNLSAAEIFREVALYSKIPQVAAELMRLDPDHQNLRILR